MAKISVTNERLHSITIASVQQARDENEANYDLFEAMSKSLVSIDSNAKEHSSQIQERLSGIESVIVSGQKIAIDELKENIERLSLNIVDTLNSSADRQLEQSTQIAQILNTLDAKLKTQLEILSSMQTTQEEANVKVDESKDRLQELRLELKELGIILSNNEQVETQNLQNILESLSSLTTKLQDEMTLLESLEKLHKIQITDTRKQTKIIETLDVNTTQANTITQETQASTLEITQKLQILQNLLVQQTQNQDKSLVTQDESKELLQKHREILELIVGKNDENIRELKRIASLQKSQSGEYVATYEEQDEAKPRGFFSKLFK